MFNVGDDAISALDRLLISVPIPIPSPMATVATIAMDMITAFFFFLARLMMVSNGSGVIGAESFSDAVMASGGELS